MKNFKEELTDGPIIETETTKTPLEVIEQNRQNKPNDGYEYVWHGDHWHRVPDPNKPKLVDYTSEMPAFKSDLSVELPADFPTDEELQQMSYVDIKHLHDLYLTIVGQFSSCRS